MIICTNVISIHALLAESDREPTALRTPHQRFLSTLSLRRATLFFGRDAPKPRYFYPRSPCGERLRRHRGNDRCPVNFYPRSPCGERPYTRTQSASLSLFLSTLSLRRATHQGQNIPDALPISIHALLAESDLRHCTTYLNCSHFYPRSPCGERPMRRTYPVRVNGISIHALLAESD